MIKKEIENDCRGCPECVGCGRKHNKVTHYQFYCDECNSKEDNLYEFDEKHLCKECFIKAELLSSTQKQIYDYLHEVDMLDDFEDALIEYLEPRVINEESEEEL